MDEILTQALDKICLIYQPCYPCESTDLLTSAEFLQFLSGIFPELEIKDINKMLTQRGYQMNFDGIQLKWMVKVIPIETPDKIAQDFPVELSA